MFPLDHLQRDARPRMPLAYPGMARIALRPHQLGSEITVADIGRFPVAVYAGGVTPENADVVQHRRLFDERQVQVHLRMHPRDLQRLVRHTPAVDDQNPVRLRTSRIILVYYIQRIHIHSMTFMTGHKDTHFFFAMPALAIRNGFYFILHFSFFIPLYVLSFYCNKNKTKTNYVSHTLKLGNDFGSYGVALQNQSLQSPEPQTLEPILSRNIVKLHIKRNIIFALEIRKKNGVPIVENVPIRMRVIYASQRIEFTTGYRIDVAKWDADKQRVKNGCTNKLKQSAPEINADLLKDYAEIQNVFKEFEVQVVMKWTGHSDYKAMKPYIDIADNIEANAMNKFNQL